MRSTNWPDDIFSFACIPNPDEFIQDLKDQAEPEDWGYQHSISERPNPILFNYIKYTYKRIAEEEKFVISPDGQYCCFNTGLVTASQESIYASFEANRQSDRQPWYMKGCFRRGRWELNKFDQLPDMAHYFDDPTCLVFDTRKELRVNIEHIIEDNRDRLPDPYKSMDDYVLQTFLKGAIDNAKDRVRRTYKAAIPQYFNGKVQLLLPLCLSSPGRADVALAVERHAQFYRGSTVLTLSMAYNNARQICKPERDWLQP